MSRIPTNPVKALHVCDFEDQYWAAVRRLKQQTARRALYAAPVTCHLRPHRTATDVDAAYCYSGLSVCHTSEPCKNGRTDRDAVWVEDLDGPKEPCIRWGSTSPIGRGNLRREGVSHCKV